MLSDETLQLGRLVPRGKLHVAIDAVTTFCGARGTVTPVEKTTAGDVLTRLVPGVCVACRRAVQRKVDA